MSTKLIIIVAANLVAGAAFLAIWAAGYARPVPKDDIFIERFLTTNLTQEYVQESPNLAISNWIAQREPNTLIFTTAQTSINLTIRTNITTNYIVGFRLGTNVVAGLLQVLVEK